MKKTLAVFMCLIFCFSLAGCSKDNIEKQNKEAKEVLMKVLEKEQTFTAKTSVLSDKTTEQTLEKYHFQTFDNAYYSFVPAYYIFVDCDTDNIDELVILDALLYCYLVLRYDGKKVYGYNYAGIGDIKKFKANGTFEPKLKDGEQKIAFLKFDGYDFEVVEKAYMNKNENKYLIDGKTEDKDTVEKYFDNWFENTPNANWLKIEE